jgi:subtilase family serine protease
VGSRYVSCPVGVGARRALLAAGMLASAAGAPAAFAAGRGANASSPPVVAHAARVGAAPTGQQLRLVLPLKVDAAGLARFATAVSTPGSPLYGRYLSVAAVARRFGASANARARVVGFLRARGASAVKVDATGLLAEATVSVGLAERMFAAPIARFRAANARFVAPVAATTVPVALRGLVEGVVGLNTEPQTSLSLPSVASAATRSLSGAAPAQAPSAVPRSGTPDGCVAGQNAGQQDKNPGFTPNQYVTAYNFVPLYAQGYHGQGQRVALIEIDGYRHSDITTFAQCFVLPAPHVSAFGVGVRRQLPAQGEATLDLEVLTAAAPGLKAVDVYETTPDAAHTLAAFAAPLQNRGRKPQVISASIGLCEAEAYSAGGLTGIKATERVLEVAAAAGISVLAASGDNGSADCQTAAGETIDALGINYPASSRWVTSVGGTNLTLSADNQILSQAVWNDTTLAPVAGGGGVSRLFTRPSYQAGVVPRNRREVPDVSMLADLVPGYSIYCTASPACVNSKNSSPWLTVGGTSASTPLLAGGMAIVDEMLRASHHENLGLLNPLIYQLGRSSVAATVFNDVTAGGNDLGPFILGGTGLQLGCCTATAGYDDASGWGSVNIAGFAAQASQLVPKRIVFALALPRHQRPVEHRELIADVSCSDACSIGAFASVKVGISKPFTVTSGLYHRLSMGSKRIKLKFSKSQLRRLRSALSQHQVVVATVYGALIDTLGAIQTQTRGKTLRIGS